MDDLFSALAFISLIALAVGLVRPSVFKRFLGENVGRKKVLTLFGGATLVLSVLFGITSESNPTTTTQENTSAQTTPQSQEPLSEEDQIKGLISDQLKGKNNLGKDYLRGAIDLSSLDDGSWNVIVEFNADDNLTTNFRKGSIEYKMADIYTALYASGKNIGSVWINAYFPLMDQYGNESDGLVYKTNLTKAEATKVNWSANPSTLKNSILPGVWTTTVLHPEFR